jgi:hypothetical protein
MQVLTFVCYLLPYGYYKGYDAITFNSAESFLNKLRDQKTKSWLWAALGFIWCAEATMGVTVFAVCVAYREGPLTTDLSALCLYYCLMLHCIGAAFFACMGPIIFMLTRNLLSSRYDRRKPGLENRSKVSYRDRRHQRHTPTPLRKPELMTETTTNNDSYNPYFD